VPIADQDEMREMVIAAFIARADTELHKLDDEIARAPPGARWRLSAGTGQDGR